MKKGKGILIFSLLFILVAVAAVLVYKKVEEKQQIKVKEKPQQGTTQEEVAIEDPEKGETIEGADPIGGRTVALEVEDFFTK